MQQKRQQCNTAAGISVCVVYGVEMIRVAETADASAIAGVLVDAWQTAYTGIVDPDYPQSLTTEKYTDIFKSTIANSAETVVVYERGNRVVGFASGTTQREQYYATVKGLYVSPDYQRRGIGSTLLEHMKKHFRAAGCRKLVIWTLQGAENNRFYETNGGTAYEEKTLNIGAKKYPGVGYCFDL